MHTHRGYSLRTSEFEKFKSIAIRTHWPTKIVSTETNLMSEKVTGEFRKIFKVFKCVHYTAKMLSLFYRMFSYRRN